MKAEAAAQVEAATLRVAELTSQLEGSSEFLQQREAMEGQLAQLKAAMVAKTKEVEQKFRWGICVSLLSAAVLICSRLPTYTSAEPH